MIFNMGAETIECSRKDSPFNEWCWESCISVCKRMKLDTSLIAQTEINSKWIIALNRRSEMIIFLDENIGRKLHNVGVGSYFLDMTPRLRQQKQK